MGFVTQTVVDDVVDDVGRVVVVVVEDTPVVEVVEVGEEEGVVVVVDAPERRVEETEPVSVLNWKLRSSSISLCRSSSL